MVWQEILNSDTNILLMIITFTYNDRNGKFIYNTFILNKNFVFGCNLTNKFEIFKFNNCLKVYLGKEIKENDGIG